MQPAIFIDFSRGAEPDAEDLRFEIVGISGRPVEVIPGGDETIFAEIVFSGEERVTVGRFSTASFWIEHDGQPTALQWIVARALRKLGGECEPDPEE